MKGQEGLAIDIIEESALQVPNKVAYPPPGRKGVSTKCATGRLTRSAVNQPRQSSGANPQDPPPRLKQM